MQHNPHTLPPCLLCGQLDTTDARNATERAISDLFTFHDHTEVNEVLDNLFLGFLESTVCDSFTGIQKSDVYFVITNLKDFLQKLSALNPPTNSNPLISKAND